MQQIIAEPRAMAVILFAVTLVLIAIGVYLVGRLRGRGDEDQLSTSDALAKFEEMHARGDLSDEEFRTIKTHLKHLLQIELGLEEHRD